MATVDHKIPLSQGGSAGKDNKVTACAACNHQKGNRTVDEYRFFLMSEQQIRYFRFYGEQYELPVISDLMRTDGFVNSTDE